MVFGNNEPDSGEGGAAGKESDGQVGIGVGDPEVVHADGVVGEGDTKILVIEPVNGFILVFAEINDSPFVIGGAEGIKGDPAAGDAEAEGVGVVVAGVRGSGVFGWLLGGGGEGGQHGE